MNIRKLILVSFFLVGMAASGPANVADCSLITQSNCKPCFRPQSDPNKRVENKWPNVTSLELDKLEVRWPTPEGSPPKYPSNSRELSASVKTVAEDPDGDVLVYTYVVTGGRIVGTGRNVMWDLNGTLPGTYTITAAVDDGCGTCGTKVTKTVSVLPAENAPACICHDIKIDSPPDRERGMTDPAFSVYISGPQPSDLKFTWTVSDGTISSGQGTRKISVRPPDERSDRDSTVTVEVSGLKSGCDCPSTATRTFKFR